jgi:hypothetical protein
MPARRYHDKRHEDRVRGARLIQEEHSLGSERSGGKILIQMREMAPSVEVRSLAAYESAAMGPR